jgi:hypothetical protein
LKIKLKILHFADVTEIQKAVTDELKDSKREREREREREIFGSFSETVDRLKACIFANEAYFEFKKAMFLPHVSLIFKKSVLTLLDRIVFVDCLPFQ